MGFVESHFFGIFALLFTWSSVLTNAKSLSQSGEGVDKMKTTSRSYWCRDKDKIIHHRCHLWSINTAKLETLPLWD